MHVRHSQIRRSVPAIDPITMPAIAPPERVEGQLQLSEGGDWRGRRGEYPDEFEDGLPVGVGVVGFERGEARRERSLVSRVWDGRIGAYIFPMLDFVCLNSTTEATV